jgi:protein tyrosine/serine phosphatase
VRREQIARHVSPLAGAFNFRDVGGLPAADGRRTRYGRFFRSDSLQELTDEDVARLVDDLAITFVIDLRGAQEAVEEGRGPLARRPVCYANVPLIDVDSPAGAPGELTVTQYLDHVESDPNLVVAIELLALVIRRPTVLHCAAGKDRTGVVTALLLGMLGVDEEAIVADYMATAENMERIVERFGRWPRYRTNMASLPAEIYRAEEHTIRVFLREMAARYGGARAWALSKGIGADVIVRVEAEMLE